MNRLFLLSTFLIAVSLTTVVRAEDENPTAPAASTESTTNADNSADEQPSASAAAADGKEAVVAEESSAEESAEQTPAEAETELDKANPGLSDLDQATQLKVAAEGLADLNEAIDLLESALEKGLDEGNTQFANELLVASLLQRASLLSAAILERPLADPRQDPRWMQIRQFALTDLQRALSIDENLTDAYLLMGRLQTLPLGDPRAARRDFTKVIDAPDVEKEQKAAAYALRGAVQEDADRQIDDFNHALELDAEKPEYLRLRSHYYFARDRFDEALADLDKSLALEPDHAATHELRGIVLLGLERYDDALESFNRAGELAPEAAKPYQYRAELYRQQGNLDKAVEQLSKSLELSPGNVATLLLRANLYFQLDKPDLAIADVEEVVRRQPQSLQAHLMRAELYASTDRMDEAIAQLEQLAKLAPDQQQVLQQLGTYCLINGQPRRAIEVFSHILEIDPENQRAIRSRGDANLNIGKHAEAIEDLSRALELNDEDEGVLNNLAWVLATSPDDNLRDGERALELATKAAERTAYQTPHILSTLAAAYAENGDFESAIKWSEKAVELGKDDPSHTQLEAELDNYREGKPVREIQEAEEKAPRPDAGDQTFAPASAPPAPARTADF